MKLTRDQLAERLRNYAMSFYGQMGYANKSGALAIAGFALMAILLTPSHDFIQRIGYWVSGLLMVTVTLVSWTVHPLFVGSAKMTVHDLVWPVLTGIAEYLMFGVLVWTPEYPKMWQLFPFAVALQGFTSWLLVVNRLAIFAKSEDFGSELGVIERKMRVSVWGSFIATTLATLFFAGMGVYTWLVVGKPNADNVVSYIVLSVFAASLLCLLAFSHATFRFLHNADEFVSSC